MVVAKSMQHAGLRVISFWNASCEKGMHILGKECKCLRDGLLLLYVPSSENEAPTEIYCLFAEARGVQERFS